MQLLTTLKLLIAHAKATFGLPPGASTCLMDMVTRSNEAFNAMVDNDVPKKMVTIQKPVHAHMGDMKVDGSEFLSMKEEDIGTSRVYYDTKKAEGDGLFMGKSFIWQPADWQKFLTVVTAGLPFNEDSWGNLYAVPNLFDSDGVTRAKPTVNQKAAIRTLRNMKENPK